MFDLKMISLVAERTAFMSLLSVAVHLQAQSRVSYRQSAQWILFNLHMSIYLFVLYLIILDIVSAMGIHE
jgi:hypothetical protein